MALRKMVIHSTHKNTSGFTLIELLIVIAIIGILAAIAIPQFNQYKIRGYDAHSKQALKDMHLLCNAYWIDNDSSEACDLPKIKTTTYGFNQNTDVVATLPPSPLNNFCASAKHNSSPNTYSIDSASLISSGSGCSGAGGSVKAATEMTAAELALVAADDEAIKELEEGKGMCTLINITNSKGKVNECCVSQSDRNTRYGPGYQVACPNLNFSSSFTMSPSAESSNPALLMAVKKHLSEGNKIVHITDEVNGGSNTPGSPYYQYDERLMGQTGLHNGQEFTWSTPSKGHFTNYYKKVRRDGKLNDCTTQGSPEDPNNCY